MDRSALQSRLHISSIDENCREHALPFGLGIEIAEFCWAYYIDCGREEHIEKCRDMMAGCDRFVFHAPFAELAACAIDPRARELARTRYIQSVGLARELGISRIVIHGGYIPYVYYPETYVSESVRFWKEFLKELPQGFEIMLENVMEPSPAMLVDIAKGVGDERLGLCLDIGHANTVVSETPPMEWIEPMAPYLKHVHIHNNRGERDTHNCLGNGRIPMEALLDKALAFLPDATFTIENMYCADSLEWLKAHGYIEQ